MYASAVLFKIKKNMNHISQNLHLEEGHVQNDDLVDMMTCRLTVYSDNVELNINAELYNLGFCLFVCFKCHCRFLPLTRRANCSLHIRKQGAPIAQQWCL